MGNLIIILVSFALFVYWFRYVCLLILQDRGAQPYAGRVASTNRLSFPEADRLLATASALQLPAHASRESLDSLERSLDRDFQLVNYLLDNVRSRGGLRLFQQAVLSLDFHLMKICYRITRTISARIAKSALREMSLVIQHMAGRLGQQQIAG